MSNNNNKSSHNDNNKGNSNTGNTGNSNLALRRSGMTEISEIYY